MKIRRRLWATIGVCAAACLAGIYSPLQAQNTNWLSPFASTEADKRLFYARPAQRWEFFAGPAASFQPLADAQYFTVSDWMYGAEGGTRFYFTRALAAGFGGQYFFAPRKKVPFTSDLESQTVYLSLRAYPLPDTLPFLWLEGGAGYMQTSFRLELFTGSKSKLAGAVFFFGTGDCFGLGRGWTLDISFRLMYMQKTDFDFLYHYSSRNAYQTAVFLSKRF